MSKIVEQARAMAKQVRFEDEEHIPNTNVFKESADLIDALAAEVEKLEALSQPVSMEPYYFQSEAFDGKIEYIPYHTATQLAAARQQGADEERAKLNLGRQTITDPAEIRRVFEIDEADYPPPDSGFAKL